jgi:hypothetical protein
LGFGEIGIARKHVRLGEHFHDEVYLETLVGLAPGRSRTKSQSDQVPKPCVLRVKPKTRLAGRLRRVPHAMDFWQDVRFAVRHLAPAPLLVATAASPFSS